MTSSDTAMLSISNAEVVYDQIVRSLHGVSLEVGRGSIVALLGANGAGKTTVLKAASGLLRAERGELTHGRIEFLGKPIEASSPRELVQQGLVQVLEGRHCFAHLSVEENLLTGALAHKRSRAEVRSDLEKVYGRFPRLREKRRTAAGFTSGGEQQMVAIGRALMARPTLILLDEPSMGLAPLIVEEIFEIVRELNQREGVSFLLAEQNAVMALRYATHGYILENGRVASQGTAEELNARADVKQFYLGVDASGRQSFRPEPRRGSARAA